MMRNIDVLDHGFVRLVDHMGDDQSIVRAARVSIAGEGVRPVSQDQGLIRYLMRHRHTTPFEMVEFMFHAKMPIFVARQWVRHRTANINEMSGRYSELPTEFYVPELKDLQVQASKNKQGRGDEVAGSARQIRNEMMSLSDDCFQSYERWLSVHDLAREVARINLPLSTYTEWYWKIDLHNLFHFLQLRLDSHSQYEIRVYAEAMAEMVAPIVPIAWEAFEDFRLNAMTFSAQELRAIATLLRPAEDANSHEFKTSREATEFLDKISKLAALKEAA